jgi:hypothetical protein
MVLHPHLLSEAGAWFLYLAVGLAGLLAVIYLLRNVVWELRYPFVFLNWLLWTLHNPFRDHWKDPGSRSARLGFNLLLFSGIGPAWWLAVHLALTPLRIANAVYFNLVLYWTVIFCDSVSELLHPRLGYSDPGRKRNRLAGWLAHFPFRLLNVFKRNGLALVEGILMTGVDIVFPTYTMYHGTSFKGIATNIAQKGRWYVGGGDYAGSGIYFGLLRKTAEHYSKGADNALIVARVTPFPCRNSATLPARLRRKIGSDGNGISRGLSFPWKSVEHWRDHSYARWFEYCLVQPGKAGQYVRTWRARPVCVLRNGVPKRIWGGLSLWTGGAGGIGAILFAWAVLALAVYALLGAM